MGIEYIKEVFENYNKIGLEDKKKLSERMIKIQSDDRLGNYFSCYYELSDIDELLNIMIKAKHFEEFYNSLDDKQKKEFQTKVYLTSLNVYSSNYYMDIYEHVVELLKETEGKIKEKQDGFVIDFDKLDSAIEEAELEDVLERVVAVYQCIAKIDNGDQLSCEMNELIRKCSAIIKENVNDSTKSKFESLPLECQVITIISLLDITQEQLDQDIVYRRELRKHRDELRKSKREKGMKKKLDSSRKLVKRRAN